MCQLESRRKVSDKCCCCGCCFLHLYFAPQDKLIQAQRNQELIEEEEYYESVSRSFDGSTSLIKAYFPIFSAVSINFFILFYNNFI